MYILRKTRCCTVFSDKRDNDDNAIIIGGRGYGYGHVLLIAHPLKTYQAFRVLIKHLIGASKETSLTVENLASAIKLSLPCRKCDIAGLSTIITALNFIRQVHAKRRKAARNELAPRLGCTSS